MPGQVTSASSLNRPSEKSHALEVASKELVRQYHKDGKRRVTIRHVEPPKKQLPLVSPPPLSSGPLSPDIIKGLRAQYLPRRTFLVTATTYDRGPTLLRIWPSDATQTAPLECWSNLDWIYLSSTQSFTGGGTEFNALVLHANYERKARTAVNKTEHGRKRGRALSHLPKLAAHGPRYAIVNPERVSEPLLDFIETAHKYYEESEASLIERSHKRQRLARERRLEAARNPADEQDIEVIYWTNPEK